MSSYLREDISTRVSEKNVSNNLSVSNDLSDASQLDEILSDLLDPAIGLSPVCYSLVISYISIGLIGRSFLCSNLLSLSVR